MIKEINTAVTINASSEKVWKILTNQKAYPNWNPFIKEFEGNLKVGEKLKVIIQAEGSSKMTFNPIVIRLEDKKLLKWKGKFLFNGLFDGTHVFELIENVNGTTTFKQSEMFKGFLVRFFNLDSTKKGFESMNKALKKQCEA